MAYIDEIIEKHGLRVHLSGREVVYAGAELGKSGGVHPQASNVIKIYEEGVSGGERHLFTTLVEETHHSKLLGIRPEFGSRQYNQAWQEIVEPRAQTYTQTYADRLRVGDQ